MVNNYQIGKYLFGINIEILDLEFVSKINFESTILNSTKFTIVSIRCLAYRILYNAENKISMLCKRSHSMECRLIRTQQFLILFYF